MSQILAFLEGLPNPEKTRLFKTQGTYTLDKVQLAWEKILKRQGIAYNPIRIGIVGTNGKGSLAFFIGELCRMHSLRYGVYTSPHFFSPNERISINGSPVDIPVLDSIFFSLNDEERNLLRELSYFEVMTILCALVFAKEQMEVEIIEAGLGGRLDATKLFSSQTIAVTKIGLDHIEILGDTEEKILKEKLGITTKYTEKIYALEPSGEKRERLLEILIDFCRENSLKYSLIPESDPKDTDYLSIYKRMSYHIFKEIAPVNVKYKFEDIPWVHNPPGRLEILKQKPFILYDTAHNPQAIGNVFMNLTKKYPEKVWVVVIGVLPDKDLDGIIHVFQKYEQKITKIRVLCFHPFNQNSKKFFDSYSQIFSIPTEFLANLAEMESFLSKMKESENLLSLGGFRIYPLLKNCLRPE